MSNLPLRSLGSVGVVSDIGPHDLPPNAFTRAVNVIFDEDRVQRAPVFKQIFPAVRSLLSYGQATGSYGSQAGTYGAATGTPATSSRFVGSYADPTYGETVFVCDADGTVRSYPNGSLVFTTPGAGTITSDETWTHAQVAGLSYLTRKGMRPYVRNIKAGGNYSLIAGDWVATDTAKVVRSYLDYVLMLNMTKAGVSYPTMVKWSNPVEYSSDPTAVLWDPSNPGYISGENVIGEMTSEIRDGLVLGTNFILYTADQVWLMEYTGSSLVFNSRRLFPTGGILNTNCVVEVEGKHFVFGEDDIYVHDGMSKTSLADKRVRRYVFNSLNRAKKSAAFVMHDPVANLIYFNYQTVNPSPAWDGTQFCNQSAIYNYRNDTWSFMDMPNVVGGAVAQYNSVTGSQRVPVVLGVTDVANGLTESRVYAMDLPSASIVSEAPVLEALRPAVAERIGLDLDDPATGLPLRSYKTIKCLVPQASLDDSAATLTFDVGSSDIPNTDPVWRTSTEFNPTTDYKVDTKVSGRYLAYRLTSKSPLNFTFTGQDAEVLSTSKR